MYGMHVCVMLCVWLSYPMQVFVAFKLIARKQQGVETITLADVHESSPLPILTPHTQDVQALLAGGGAGGVDAGGATGCVVPSGHEGLYAALWNKASAGSDTLGPGDAVVFFRTSGLDDVALSVIWEKADSTDPRGQLSQVGVVVFIYMCVCVYVYLGMWCGS